MNPARNLGTTITIALLLTAALAGCSTDDPKAQPDPTPVADDSTPSPSSQSSDGPIDMVGLQGPLEPGLYSLAAWGESDQTGPLPRTIADVPEGYHSTGGYVIDAGDGATDDQYGDIWVWHVVQVPTDPCRRRTAVDAGATVQDLARALARQAGPSTRPEPVVLDGHPGLTMEVAVPRDIDLSQCTAGEYSLWRTERRGDGAYSTTTPGLVNRLWIVDVDGTRLILTASLYPDQGPALHQEQIAIAESVQFEPAQ